MSSMKIIGAIIAGGKGRRMAQLPDCPKALTPFLGKPLIAHIHDRLAPQLDDIILNAPDQWLDLPLAPDQGHGRGPLGGVLTVMTWLQDKGRDADALLTTACDTPFLPSDLATRLADVFDGDHPVVARSTRLQPLCALWPLSLKDVIKGALDQNHNRTDRFLAECGAVGVEFPTDPIDPFFNINTPDDLARAEQLARDHNLI